MDSSIWLLVGCLFGLVVLSAFFSGSEVALFSMRRVDRREIADSSTAVDKILFGMLRWPRRLIATILIGNEVVNVSVSVLVASVVPMLFDTNGGVSQALVSTAVALPLLLVFGEIVPKSVALKKPKVWAKAAAFPLRVWWVAITPVRFVVRGAVQILTFPLGGVAKQWDPPQMSELEFRTLVDQSNAEGQVDEHEQSLIHRVFEFGDKTVKEVMTPRAKIFALSYDVTRGQLVKAVGSRGYSRVPIYQKSLDNIRGVLYARDLVVHTRETKQPGGLQTLLHEPLFVPYTIPCARLFRVFQHRKIHMALVVNEYGKLSGLVTMEDLLEELFGEIRDEREQQKTSSQAPPFVSKAASSLSGEFASKQVAKHKETNGKGPIEK